MSFCKAKEQSVVEGGSLYAGLSRRERQIVDQESSQIDAGNLLIDRLLIEAVTGVLVDRHTLEADRQSLMVANTVWRRVIGLTDHYFDTHRPEFRQSLGARNPNHFIRKLLSIPCEDSKIKFTTGELFAITRKLAASSLYRPSEQSLLLADIDYTQREAFSVMFEVESRWSSVGSAEMIRHRTITNQAASQGIFDFRYASFMDRSGYIDARNRFVAMAIALQYIDDVADCVVDERLGCANLFSALCRESGEELQLKTNLRDANVREGDLEEIIGLSAQFAPAAYERVKDLQQEQLQIARSDSLDRSSALS